jgi:hypothetical protein
LFAKRINHKTTKKPLYKWRVFWLPVVVGASTNRKAVDEVVLLAFVISLILLTSLSKEVYKVIVKRLAAIMF